MDVNSNGIFGTFRPLTAAQIKGNAIFVAAWSASFMIVVVGVALAVVTGIIWIGAASAAICVCLLCFVARIRNLKYVPKFGIKYNLMRMLIGGSLVYSSVAWRGLLGIYFRIVDNGWWNVPISTYGWALMWISLAITLLSKISLYRIEDVQVADLVGVIEVTALAILVGSIMFILLYT
ncbi:MAG: hypothetical protein ACI4UL_09615 [Muribaculaceae bacterium]